MPEFTSQMDAHVREWRQLAQAGEDVEARRAELQAICRVLLRELSNDHVWLVWQVVRGHLTQFRLAQLADMDGVRESNRGLEDAAHLLLKHLRKDLRAAIRLHERRGGSGTAARS